MVQRRYEGTSYTYTGKDMGQISPRLDLPVVQPFLAVELMFSTPLRYWSGLSDLVAGGNTYLGLGTLLEVSQVNETGDIRAASATVKFSGLNGAFLSAALSLKYHGRIAKIQFGMTTPNDSFLLAESGDYLVQESRSLLSISQGSPSVLSTLFVGYMDQMTIDEGPETSTVLMSLESKLVDLERPRVKRYTTESQSILYPNDKAFDFVNDLQTRPMMWGKNVGPKGGLLGMF
tara:strand:- start:4433 stop:5128 length:696 start_codon:yes stop_codon:yes gene_type:complete